MSSYKLGSDGQKIFIEESGKSHALTEDLTGVATLTAEDSGKCFSLKAAAGAVITLPAVASVGFNARFVTGLAFATINWTIVSPTDVIQGNALVAGAHVAASNENTISFVATAESLGDYVDILSDGTNYYVSGSGVTAGSIIFSA
tara:strand:+ start:1465 stop:1899 length:435 start_codon:yes stop_codon:yes gene_type:complete